MVTQASEDEAQYRIEATGGFREPRSRILKHGDTFAVLNQFGDIVNSSGSPDGLYNEDTRHLSQLEPYLNGDRPLLLTLGQRLNAVGRWGHAMMLIHR